MKRRINELHTQAEHAKLRHTSVDDSTGLSTESVSVSLVAATAAGSETMKSAFTAPHKAYVQSDRNEDGDRTLSGTDTVFASTAFVAPRREYSPLPAPQPPPRSSAELMIRNINHTPTATRQHTKSNASVAGAGEQDFTVTAFCAMFGKALLVVLCPCTICILIRRKRKAQPGAAQHAVSYSANQDLPAPATAVPDKWYDPTIFASGTSPHGSYQATAASAAPKI